MMSTSWLRIVQVIDYVLTASLFVAVLRVEPAVAFLELKQGIETSETGMVAIRALHALGELSPWIGLTPATALFLFGIRKKRDHWILGAKVLLLVPALAIVLLVFWPLAIVVTPFK